MVKVKGGKSQSNKKGSCLRTTLEVLLFLVWLACTGIAGYIFGRTPLKLLESGKCPQSPPPEIIRKTQHCEEDYNITRGDIPVTPETGYSFEEIKKLWACSRANSYSDITKENSRILPKNEQLKKTKWKSVISIDPKPFFDKYLSQYPGDMGAIQPVVLFSHKPLKSMNDIPTVCKVLDIAVVPDVPGVCVAVTETYHDVASYHMLHADKQPDGTFALTGT